LRETAPAWDRALNAGKESVVCDLKSEAGLALARALLARADVVLEGFRPGVAARLGVGPDDARTDAVYCSITGFGAEGPHVQRAGHDLNYLGWAGALADTAPALPPLQIADLAAGALGAVTQILAALLEGGGARITVSMTHRAHDLVAHRLSGEPVPKLLTGGVACYRIYATADGRFLTVAALEPKFWQRLCELVGLGELIGRQWEPRLPELERVFASRSLADWLELFDGEDVSVGPVATLEEAAQEFSSGEQLGSAPRLGEHTEAWRAERSL
jgi:crotonobetainyl-CoA:carnitine CoA-transferase CaiB-like acyl-CoA transferase